jgi:DNA recombination protein RmuC
MPDQAVLFYGGVVLVALLVSVAFLYFSQRYQNKLRATLEERHRDILATLQEGLLNQGGRLSTVLMDMSERIYKTLTEQGRADQELIQGSLRNTSQQLIHTIEALTKTTDTRLEQISGKVAERLDEGFKKTNETFVSVMARLATIDEAQKKIDGLTSNVVSLQELLGDKRSRGAFGEIQLANLIRNVLPQQAYAMQHTLSNGRRADCVLFMPEPLGALVIDSKFPLENYHRMFAQDVREADRTQAQRQFKADVKKHIDDISQKYIIQNETCDGAVMFVPAEAVFAEIHAYHSDLADYAHQKRVWVVSPTTMMAIITTTSAVMKDIETRKQVHIIQEALGKLAQEFKRFDERMKKLADHIRQAHQDAEEVHTTSQKISRSFARIERVEVEPSDPPALDILNNGEEK